ncbi:MAG: hypothetical protein RLY14_3268, partial [Planctomycetota bacterium]
MKIETSQDGSTIRIQFVGDLTGPIDDATRLKMIELVQPNRKLIVDLSQWHTCSGMTLRRLLLMFRWVRSQGCSIELHGLNESFSNCADAAGFTDLFYESDETLTASKYVHVPAPRIDVFPTQFQNGYGIRPGIPYPFGASPVTRGINFSVYSKHAERIHLVLFRYGQSDPVIEIPFPTEFRVGHVFAMIVYDIDPEEYEYGYRVFGPYSPHEGHLFDESHVLLDPHARCIAGFDGWGQPRMYENSTYPFRTRILPEDYDWQGDRQLETPTEDLIIYEIHVRGFTRSDSANVRYPGTFAAIREKIPYLKELGVNCIELMPIFEFDEKDNPRMNPLTGERLWNYWGYNTIAFQAPKASYAASHYAQLQSEELKSTIKELHRNGIEIILDVVFN